MRPLDFGRTLVVAPHPDDEVLGCGGTIARLTAQGAEVCIAVVTTGRSPRYSKESVAAVRAEASKSHALLGVTDTRWLDQPAAELAEHPHGELNAAIGDVVKDFDPETVLMPFVGDIHRDHQLVFESVMVASRPYQDRYPRRLLAYETLSETNWNAAYLGPAFVPNVYVDIGDTLERKLEAMQTFASQLKAFPQERSLDAIRALATFRGSTVHRMAAEAFVHIRETC